MNVGIVTFHSAHNHGAVLQAWSLKEYLKKQGHQVEIVNLRLEVIDRLYKVVYPSRRKITGNKLMDCIINKSYYWLKLGKSHIIYRAAWEKYNAFEEFIGKSLPVTEEYRNFETLKEAGLQYDALIAGSDQIWNAVMMKGINPAYFLDFGDGDTLRISYAVSIGTEEIPEEYKELFKRNLPRFDFISVREKKALEQISNITDKKVDLVADPTFLLKREDFDKIKKNPNCKSKYIYVHNVHLKRKDERMNGVVEELSRRLGLPIIHNWTGQIFSNEAGHFLGDPGEFLGFVSQAEYVVTNSFHCTVFSIIYNKNFITVPHFKHPDRMKNLLEDMGLNNHLIESSEEIPMNMDDLYIDYQAISKKREDMGAHAREFLRKALQAD